MTWPSELSQWSLDPSIVIGIGLAAILYWRGRRSLAIVRGDRKGTTRLWNALAFYAGLGVLILALESPIDSLSASLFSIHMLQHVLLIMVAAPLLLLGNPAVTIMRGVPLRLRRRTLGAIVGQTWIHRLSTALAWLRRPVPTFIIFVGDLYLWHWAWLFNLTLQNDTVHLVEHLCFLATALLFWSQVIDQRALPARLSYTFRAGYTVIAAAASNVLAMYIVFTPKPLYSAYADLQHRTFGMTPLGDQQIAGAIMWVPVLFLFGGAFVICLYKALAEDERQSEILPVPGTPYGMSVIGGPAGTNRGG